LYEKRIVIIPEAAAVENDEKNAEYENNEDYPDSSPKVYRQTLRHSKTCRDRGQQTPQHKCCNFFLTSPKVGSRWKNQG